MYDCTYSKMKKIIYFCLLLCIKRVVLNSCETHKKCDLCIQEPGICVWCTSPDIKGPRCMPATVGESWCAGHVENPISAAEKAADLDFSAQSGALRQIKPQGFSLRLRPGQTQKFRFAVKVVQDYPVDLYFLFDASRSMATLKNNTAMQAKNIFDAMLTMTRDVYMGVGTFVDKNALPYTTHVAANKAYSFKHHLTLQSDYKKFQEVVSSTPSGENKDAPEGVFDALAQALVCKEHIGWRRESRKIIFLLTDGYYHAAGDGKPAGIFKPYDGQCHTENGVYKNELTMDYPSLSMINKLATDNKIIVIFIVPNTRRAPYQSIAKFITGSKVITLSSTNSDIVDKLKEIYEDISRQIKLDMNVEPPGRPKHFEITFKPDCTRENVACDVTGKENNFKEFDASIKLLRYDDYNSTEIGITLDGIEEKLRLKVDIIKDCECQNEAQLHSALCNGEAFACGLCECSLPRFGDRCQCTRMTTNSAIDNSGCIYDRDNSTCNGRGVCSCGVCTSCQEGYVGPYCQCLSSACPLHEGKVCGGRGQCQCDRSCACEPGYSGDACHCKNNVKECIGPDNKICNKRGTCECDTCKCDPIGSWDKRTKYDEFCIMRPCEGCHEQQCEALAQCALCLLRGHKPCSCPEHHTYETVDLVTVPRNDSDWHLCSAVRIDVGCYTNFTYKYDQEEYGILLTLQREKNCVMSYYVYGGIVLGSLLLIGILTLVGWKLCTNYRDKQEYEKFLKDYKSEIAPCENPLFVPAATQFRNPAFRKRSVK